MSRELLRQALDVIKKSRSGYGDDYHTESERHLMLAIEVELFKPEIVQVRPAEFIAAASIGVGADFVGTPMMWAEWPTPKSSTVRWSIPVDPNNFGEPVAQPVQEPTECGYDETVGMCTNNPCCEQTPVAYLWECIGRWSAYLASNGEKAKLAPPEWLVDAVKDATARPTRPWVGLTDKERNEMIGKIQHDQFTRQRDLIGSTQIITEMYLKEKNHGN